MKSYTYVALLTILVIVIFPWVSGRQDDNSKDMAKFVPESALLYFEQHHGSSVLKEFRESPLGKKFEEIQFIETGKRIGLKEPLLVDIKNILSFYSSAKDSRLFHEIFGEMFAGAILFPIDRKKYADVKSYIRDNSVIISKPKHSAKGLEFLGESYLKFTKTHSVSNTQYGSYHIWRLRTNVQTLSVATVKGFFVMSLNERQLRRCIDTFDAELPALADDDDYLEIRKSFEMSDRFFYLPIKDTRKFIVKAVKDLSFPWKKLLLKELETTVGFLNFGYGSWNSKESVVDKVMVKYDKYEVNKVVKNHTNIAPIPCSMLSLTTEDPMAFYWSNTVKLKHILQYFEENTKNDPQVEKFWSTVESVTGMNTRQIFSLLGGEVSLVFEPGPKDDFFSFPLGMFFLKVKDVAKLNSVFEKIIDEYDIQVSVKLSGPVRYTYWTPSPQDGLQPLYGFWGDLLFLGNSSKLLDRIIEKKSREISLLDNESVKVIDPGFTEKNNSITYMNNVQLIKVLQKFLTLVGMTVAIENREMAFKARAIIEDIVNPLLEGASMYDKSSTRSYFTPEMVIVDSITNKTISPAN